MSHVSFQLVPLAEGYSLEIELFGTPQTVIFSQKTPAAQGSTGDLYSQNGPFTKDDIDEFKKALIYGLKAHQTLLVLDLKDEEGGYSELLRLDSKE